MAGGLRLQSPSVSEFSNFTKCRAMGSGTNGGGAIYVNGAPGATQHHLVVDECRSNTASTAAGAIKQLIAAAEDTYWSAVIFIRQDASYCVHSQAGCIVLEGCQFISCASYFQVTSPATINVSLSAFDIFPLPSTSGVTHKGCGQALGPAAFVACFQADAKAATLGCAAAIVCPNSTPLASPEETLPESGKESRTASRSESRAETGLAGASSKETDPKSPQQTPLATDEGSEVSDAPSPSVDVSAPASGGSSAGWIIGMAVGFPVILAIGVLIGSLFCRGGADRVVEKKEEEEGKNEAAGTDAAGPLPPEKTDSEGGKSPQVEARSNLSGSDSEGGGSSGRGQAADSDNGEPVQIVSAVGARTTIAVPLKRQLSARCHIEARFEPEVAGLSLSTNKAWIEPGAVEYPFSLFFEPTEEGSFETTLVVSFGEFETQVPILASTGSGAHRRHRAHRPE
jgi:hypothetical protein